MKGGNVCVASISLPQFSQANHYLCIMNLNLNKCSFVLLLYYVCSRVSSIVVCAVYHKIQPQYV